MVQYIFHEADPTIFLSLYNPYYLVENVQENTLIKVINIYNFLS